ncbi:hypothetical protein RJ641_014151 [Dillenia turbinata]|uniref:Uncharacterized protein n=1 Tax=Dillenia turbinata TaxID=194707 RepID=A0AAN8V303_9MAGN
MDLDGTVSLHSVHDGLSANGRTLRLSYHYDQYSWLSSWNMVFQGMGNQLFVPIKMLGAIRSCIWRATLLKWLKVSTSRSSSTVYDYASIIQQSIIGNWKLAFAYTHFLYHSFSKKYLSESKVAALCKKISLVDNYRQVALIGSNEWRNERDVELGDEYLLSGRYAGESTEGEQLMKFLKTHVSASDIPYLHRPNAVIPVVFFPLTKENAFLLLEWIRN